MKLTTLLLASTVTALTLISAGVQAQTVGYVDIERVTAKASGVTQAVRDATDQMTEMQRKLDDKARAIQDLDAQLRRDEGTLSSDRIEEKRREKSKLEGERFDLERDMRVKERSIETDLFVPLRRKIKGAIDEVAKKRKIDVVLPAKDLLYGSASADLTTDVILKLGVSPTEAKSTEDKATTDKADTAKSASTDTKDKAADADKAEAVKPVSLANPSEDAIAGTAGEAAPVVTSAASAEAVDHEVTPTPATSKSSSATKKK